MNSCMMDGKVIHQRISPVWHYLEYQLFMPLIDLDELDEMERSVWGFGRRFWHWARFKRSDYLGSGSLKQAVQDKVFELTGEKPQGKVKTLCQLRYFGFYFSPVNFYYLYDDKGRFSWLLAEVSNTPWNERHYYAVAAQPGENGKNWAHSKAFHVSPFNPLDQQYKWHLREPGESLSLRLDVCREQKEFTAGLSMKAVSLSRWSLVRYFFKTPLVAAKILWGIYWHALKLWLKGAPFYSHPSDKEQSHVIQ